LQNITGRGVTAKGLLLEYVRLNPAGGLELLEYVEQGFEYGREVFGYDKSEEFDAVLRKTLEVYGMMPERPQGWVDPYPPFVRGICLSVNCRHWRDDSSIHLSGYNNCRQSVLVEEECGGLHTWGRSLERLSPVSALTILYCHCFTEI
jgi:hypothetical protein